MNARLLFLVACLSLFWLPLAPASADPQAQTTQSHQWNITQGVNPVDLTMEGVHIIQKDATDTTAYSSASTPFLLNGAAAWRVAFDVRFGALHTAGGEVRLLRGETVIAKVGADGWYKGMGAFIGQGDSKFGLPADQEWHHFIYDCNGRTVTLWHNGVKVAEGGLLSTPDRLAVGSWWDGHGPAGQQTEISVRGVSSEAYNAQPEAHQLEAYQPETRQVGLGAFHAPPLPANPPIQTKYRVYSLESTPDVLSVNWFLDLEITNDTDQTETGLSFDAFVHFADGMELPLITYDPARSYPVGKMFNPLPYLSIAAYDIKPHSKRIFQAYWFDTPALDMNYSNPNHRAQAIVVTEFSKEAAVLPVHGL